MMDVLLWLGQKENATLILAMIGAVNGTLGLLISFLNRADAIGQVQREQAHLSPWISLQLEEGDHTGCMVRATVFNPRALAFVITEISIVTPHDWRAILMHPDPTDLLGPLIPDTRNAGTTVPVNWTVKAAAETPERPSFQEGFIVASERWTTEAFKRWRPASKMRQTTLAIRFSGHTLSASQEPIELLVKASN